MKNNSIACQVHIPNTSHQGDGLDSTSKIKVVELSLEYLRYKNPDTYISLSGHGDKPSSKILDLCDFVNWENIKSHRTAAQYDSVYPAVHQCKKMGYKNILKVRADGIYGIPNFADYCEGVLKKEKRDLLVTQMTANIDNKMGDCVMYGNSKLVDYLWDVNHKQHHWDGLVHIGTNFYNYYSTGGEKWIDIIRKHCSFKNISTLKWMDLRYNFNELNSLGWDMVRDKLLNDEFDLTDYYWGNKNGWHTFDKNNKMVYSIEPYYLEENTFYENI